MTKTKLTRIVGLSVVVTVLVIAIALGGMFIAYRFFGVDVPLFSDIADSMMGDSSMGSWGNFFGNADDFEVPELPSFPDMELETEPGGSAVDSGGNIGWDDDIDLNKKMYTLYSTVDGELYLKSSSFGDYNGHGWEEAPVYSEKLMGIYPAFYLPGAIMQNEGYEKYRVTVTPYTDLYVVPYYVARGGMDTSDIASNDVAFSGNASQGYNISFYKEDDLSNLSHRAYYSDYEAGYRNFVYDNYLYVDDDTKDLMLEIIYSNGFSLSSSDVIDQVAEYIKSSASYNIKYDRTLDSAENVVRAFLTEYNEGICQHYAASATLLYRTLGIPARYTVGFYANVDAYTYTEVIAANGHAWVEVYIDGVGWQKVEVTGGDAYDGDESGDGETDSDTETETETGEGSGGGSGGGIGPGGDFSGSIGLPQNFDQDVPIYDVYKTSEGEIYLKRKSFGAYDGSWQEAVEFGDLLWNEYSAAYIQGIMAGDYNYLNQYYAEISLCGAPGDVSAFVLPSYISTGTYITQKSDTVMDYSGYYSDIPSSYYAYYYYLPDFSYLNPADGELAEFESAYREFVYSNYLDVDGETFAYLTALAQEYGINYGDSDNIEKIADFIRKRASYNLNYDRALDGEDNIVISFLDEYRQGVCQHYATAATLMYRAMGIPARYTVGYYVNSSAGTTATVFSGDAHAWVEVYVDGYGWMTVDTTGYEGIKVTLSPKREGVVYDGEEKQHSGEFTGFEKYEKEGYTIVANVVTDSDKNGKYDDASGPVELGLYPSRVDPGSVKVYSPDGEDVTYQFQFSFRTVNLHVCKAIVTFESIADFGSVQYNGQEQAPYSVYLSDERLPEEVSGFDISITGAKTDSGSNYSASFGIELYDESGNPVTESYFIVKKVGRFSITPIKLTLRPDDKWGSEDELSQYSPLCCEPHEYSVISGALVEGHIVGYFDDYGNFAEGCYMTGSAYEWGEGETRIDFSRTGVYAKISDGWGGYIYEDMSKNYYVTAEPGGLYVQ